MPAESLLNVTIATLVRRIRLLEDIGNTPWGIIARVIHKVDSPVQLETLERNSPWLKDHTADIWITLIKRDAPEADSTLLETGDNTDWASRYRDARKGRDEQVKRSSAMLAATLKNHEQEKQSNLMRTTSSYIKTANNQVNRKYTAQWKRDHPQTTGQKLRAKAIRDSNKSVAVRNKNIKPVAPIEIKEARQLDGNSRAHLERSRPAPLPKKSMALLQAKRDREVGLSRSTAAQSTSPTRPIQRPTPLAAPRPTSSNSSGPTSPPLHSPPQSTSPSTTYGRDGPPSGQLSNSSAMFLQRRREHEARMRIPRTMSPVLRNPMQSQYRDTMKRGHDDSNIEPAARRQRVV